MPVDLFFNPNHFFVLINIFSEPPIISTDNSHVFISPGDNVDLKCSVIGETFPDIRWFKETELVRFCRFNVKFEYFNLKVTRHRTSPNGYLQIRLASEEEDSGNYTCSVHNTVGSSSVSIRLDVGSNKKKKANLFYFDYFCCYY